MITRHAGYIGRFAPSPTGPLHFGSLIAALGSHVDARAAGGTWRLRIDDLDPPRTVPGAADDILWTLEAFGLHWDGSVVRQSHGDERYAAARDRLHDRGLLYRCACSRRELARVARTGPLGRIYPGTCRHRPPPPERPAAIRVALPDTRLEIDDHSCGRVGLDAARDIGDVTIQRRDGIWAYHLATTIDDDALGITHVVRGADLLPAALVQTALEQLLGLRAPCWRHLPLARTTTGAKLSKQTGAEPVDRTRPIDGLLAAWERLGQLPLPDRPATVSDFHAWAVTHWAPERIPAEAPVSA